MSNERRLSRREFSATTIRSGLALGALAAGPLVDSIWGANDKITMGLIGCGGQGRYNVAGMRQTGAAEIVAVCDVYQPHLDAMARALGRGVTRYRDFRELLAQDDIDAVIVATPDHWHALPVVMACEAGKDVYAEKPLARTVEEGRAMVDAARRHGRVVQTGLQQRSGRHFQRAVELVASGYLGAVSFVRCWNYSNAYPHGIGAPFDSPPPEGLDWDFWLGPAPEAPYNVNRQRHFRWFWDYAGGKLTDWGVHLIDIVQWAMGVDAPQTVHASGGKFFLQDNRETPDTLAVTYNYPGFLLTYEHRACNAAKHHGRDYGIAFYGSDATLVVDRAGFEVLPESGSAVRYREEPGSEQHLPHCKDFVTCVRNRQRPIGDVEICHRSTTAPHLGNIAYHVGRKLVWDAARERVIGDREANRMLRADYRRPWRLPG